MTKDHGKYQRGFSLIELMVTAAILVILVSLAVPTYRNFAVKSVRTQAKSALLLIADRQEQFFLDNKGYADDLVKLGFPADPLYVDSSGFEVTAGSDDRVYKVKLSNVSATTYTASAVPQLQQAEGDGACGTFSLTHTGIRSQSGPYDDCW